MRFADAEQWLAGLLLGIWVVVAALSAAGRIRRVRGRVLAATGVAAVLLVAQAMVVDAVADPDGISGIDQAVLGWIVDHRGPAPTGFFLFLDAAGGTVGMAVVAAAAAVVALVLRRYRDAGVIVLAAVGSGLLVTGLKNLYGRPRPPELTRLTTETSFSLPSGHTLSSTVVLGIVAAFAVRATGRRIVQVLAVVVAAAGALAIGVSRLYLGVHWLSDVLDAWLVGGAWLVLCVGLAMGRPVLDRARA